jgi:hypothetical protein
MSYCPSQDWDRYIGQQEAITERELAVEAGEVVEVFCIKHQTAHYSDEACWDCEGEAIEAEDRAHEAWMKLNGDS